MRVGPAEQLPWPDASFDVVLSQLVLSFMRDAPAGLQEMRRVVRSGGAIACCMWEAGARMPMVGVIWEAALALGVAESNQDASMRYRTREELQELADGAGLGDWSLGDAELTRLAEETRRRLAVPQGPFELEAHAWAFRGTA